jgi:hypothetical protein
MGEREGSAHGTASDSVPCAVAGVAGGERCDMDGQLAGKEPGADSGRPRGTPVP